MFWDWWFTPAKDLSVGNQVSLEVFKWLLGLGTLLLITRWTLKRADRKDAIARQATVLSAFGSERIQNLTDAVTALAKIRLHLSDLKQGLIHPGKLSDTALERIQNAREQLDVEVDLSFCFIERYGRVPGSIPCDYVDLGEAYIFWLEEFYQHVAYSVDPVRGYETAYKACSDLQVQLRWLATYERGMQLSSALNPASVWNPALADKLEENYMPFLENEEHRINREKDADSHFRLNPRAKVFDR